MISQHAAYNTTANKYVHPVPTTSKPPSDSPPTSTMTKAMTYAPDQYMSSGFPCCQDYRYGRCLDPQDHTCTYSTYHAAPCFAASTSRLTNSQSGWFASPTDSGALSGNYGAVSDDPYTSTWAMPLSSTHDDVSSHVNSHIRSVSPAESSDSDLSYTACDEITAPPAADRVMYRPSYMAAVPSSSVPSFMPAVYPLQQVPSHLPQHVNAASHSPTASTTTNVLEMTASSHLDFDLSSIASAPSHQAFLSDATPATAPIMDEPIIHHPRPRRPFLNRLLTQSVPSDDELVTKEASQLEVKDRAFVQSLPLSSSSLLCQPAPPSVMFPDMVGQAVLSGGSSSFDPATAVKNSSSSFHYPYDVNEVTQNTVVCSCGCMGSYLMA